jgi:hypothetical protein
MLETILAYATKRFEATDDGEVVRERHYHYFLARAERHGTDQALLGADATERLARLDAEAENLKAALGWAVDRHDRGRAIAAVAAVGRYWRMRDRRRHGSAQPITPLGPLAARRSRALRAVAVR